MRTGGAAESRDIRRVLRFAELLEAAGPGQQSVAVPDTLLRSLFAVPTYETLTPALDGLLDSGRMSLIEDMGVRSAVAAWTRSVRNTAEHQLRARRLADDQLVPALSDRGNVGHVVRGEVAMFDRLLAVDPNGTTMVSVDGHLEAVVSLRFNAAARATLAIEDLLVRTEDLLQAIRATQAR